MILNTGARTDTVQYFSDWLLKRFEEGFVYMRNPLFPNKVTRYELSPDKIDAVLFCSKNYAPILPRIREFCLSIVPDVIYSVWQIKNWSKKYVEFIQNNR